MSDTPIPEWLENALSRAVDIRRGCPPPGTSVDDLRARIGEMDSSELAALNPVPGENGPTTCESPYHILGITRDGKVAYYGLNHIGSAEPHALQDCLASMIQEGDRDCRSTASTALRELTELLYSRQT
ncbi:MAG: hypothetical protein AABX70_04965 [Nanoarchaeota archaeon]